ncbi:MAG: hypothetical protein OEN23_06800 [Paracoccaceae bacterium]|nr:hypothetical protein [Paracoccaceae bacterium]
MGAIKNKLKNHILPYFKMPDRKPVLVQAREMWRLYRKYGRLPTQYLANMLYRRCAPSDVMSFMPSALLKNLQNELNDPNANEIADDKFQFRRTLAAQGFPVIHELFRILDSGEIRNADDQVIDESAARHIIDAHNAPVFVKLIGGSFGAEAFILPAGANRDRLFVDRTGFIVQPVLEQHETLASLNPETINGIRIDTLLIGDRCISSGAILKIGTGDAVVDNGGQGGLLIQVDIETGQLVGRARQKARFGPGVYLRHPETDAPFVGLKIPFWDQLRALVAKAARALPQLPTLGWDVGLTPTGPVLIEANRRWQIESMQSGETGIGDTPVGRAALSLDRRGRVEPFG